MSEGSSRLGDTRPPSPALASTTESMDVATNESASSVAADSGTALASSVAVGKVPARRDSLKVNKPFSPSNPPSGGRPTNKPEPKNPPSGGRPTNKSDQNPRNPRGGRPTNKPEQNPRRGRPTNKSEQNPHRGRPTNKPELLFSCVLTGVLQRRARARRRAFGRGVRCAAARR